MESGSVRDGYQSWVNLATPFIGVNLYSYKTLIDIKSAAFVTKLLGPYACTVVATLVTVNSF